MSRDRQLQKIRDLHTEIEDVEREVERLVKIAERNIVTTREHGTRHHEMEACRGLLRTAQMALEEAGTWIRDTK